MITNLVVSQYDKEKVNPCLFFYPFFILQINITFRFFMPIEIEYNNNIHAIICTFIVFQ